MTEGVQIDCLQFVLGDIEVGKMDEIGHIDCLQDVFLEVKGGEIDEVGFISVSLAVE